MNTMNHLTVESALTRVNSPRFALRTLNECYWCKVVVDRQTNNLDARNNRSRDYRIRTLHWCCRWSWRNCRCDWPLLIDENSFAADQLNKRQKLDDVVDGDSVVRSWAEQDRLGRLCGSDWWWSPLLTLDDLGSTVVVVGTVPSFLKRLWDGESGVVGGWGHGRDKSLMQSWTHNTSARPRKKRQDPIRCADRAHPTTSRWSATPPTFCSFWISRELLDCWVLVKGRQGRKKRGVTRDEEGCQ